MAAESSRQSRLCALSISMSKCSKKILAEDPANARDRRTCRFWRSYTRTFWLATAWEPASSRVKLGEGSGCVKSGAGDLGRALSAQDGVSGQGGIDDRDLGAGIQQKVVGAGMVDGYGHDNLVAVDEMEGYTCDISRAVGFCIQAWKPLSLQERTKRDHLKFVIARAPQPGRLRSLWARGSTWS